MPVIEKGNLRLCQGDLRSSTVPGVAFEPTRRESLTIHRMKPSMTQAHSQAHTKRVCRFHIGWIPKCRNKCFGNLRRGRSANRFQWLKSQATGKADGSMTTFADSASWEWQAACQDGLATWVRQSPNPIRKSW